MLYTYIVKAGSQHEWNLTYTSKSVNLKKKQVLRIRLKLVSALKPNGSQTTRYFWLIFFSNVWCHLQKNYKVVTNYE